MVDPSNENSTITEAISSGRGVQLAGLVGGLDVDGLDAGGRPGAHPHVAVGVLLDAEAGEALQDVPLVGRGVEAGGAADVGAEPHAVVVVDRDAVWMDLGGRVVDLVGEGLEVDLDQREGAGLDRQPRRRDVGPRRHDGRDLGLLHVRDRDRRNLRSRGRDLRRRARQRLADRSAHPSSALHACVRTQRRASRPAGFRRNATPGFRIRATARRRARDLSSGACAPLRGPLWRAPRFRTRRHALRRHG